MFCARIILWDVIRVAKEKKEVQEKMEENKKNYIKNTIILAIIFIVCMCLTLYLCKWFNVYEEYEKEIPVIRDSLGEITVDDLEHYVIDTPSTIVYMCTSNDDVCRSFEKDFKKYIQKNDISDEIVYLNLTGVDIDSFVTNFNQQFQYKIKLNGRYPAFVVFQDGEVTSILQGSKTKKVTISKVQNFLELNLYEEEEEVKEEQEEA